MGLIWDMIQHGQIQATREHADSLEQRVAELEQALQRTNETLIRLLQALEQRFGDDLNGDGRVA